MTKEFVKSKNAVVMYLSGELDQYAAAELKNKIDVEMENSDKKNLIMNMTDVTMMDSSGIGLIIGRYKFLQARGGKVFVCGGNNSVKKVITLSGIEKLIPYYNTLREAENAAEACQKIKESDKK